MDWVKTFYEAQNEWFGVYLGPVEESHRERALLLNKMTDSSAKKVLELGAGGGQTAIALAELGHEVSMIELLEESVWHAQKLSHQMKVEIAIQQGDFYTFAYKEQFDLICYFDSFGIGTDEDQRNLLRRMAAWLKPNGSIIIEVGATWYWAGIANGRTMDLGACFRQYNFDVLEARLVDSWWRKDDPNTVVRQFLRCYTPVDFQLLLEGTGLQLMDIQAGGRVDYEQMEFIKEANLEEAMTYYVKLSKEDI
ncbi:bifunctional 2-polyprenyl-6-hydroxyphenol methylase/3-demethylubiquinol 3-O-methyltransferase UbiG [Aureispira sp. CCB-QB1]|uniref:class I SAM-dependent methyltransferase n=1 Tax=Aureispira sp. CCB-QB1 TaxID=1313421 RepID=UPI00069635DA|nr:class I SAM-dependent methyltransferase [Aureispira sp. CCB-QB1]